MKQMILEKWNRRYTIGIVLFFFLLILGIVLRSSYGLFSINVEKENSLLLVAGDLHYDFTSTELGLEGEIVVSAKERKEFEIEITSKNEMATLYQVYYEGSPSSEVIVGYLENERYQGIGEIGSKEKVVLQIIIENKSTEEVRIRLGVQGGMIDKPLTLTKGKELVKITLPIYTDESGANAPELVEGMISVVYDETKNSWVKQDTNKSYAYQDQIWANAVTVTEENRETYQNAPIGTEISMEDINTMWVWIPRYEYMYTNLGIQYAGGSQRQPGEIKVNFLSGTSTTPSDAANYKIHPAFTFGEEELSGIWVGKFETGGTLTSACTNELCDTSNIVIKPGVKSLTKQTISSFFYMGRSMRMNTNNPYGFSNTTRDLHMSKNSEWGSVDYLSQSKYGKYGNPDYIGADKEVAINNCNKLITGIGGDTVSASNSSTSCTTNTYETLKGQAASTTGNITGVYDMSGGNWEYVMGVLADDSGAPRSGYSASYNSGFNGTLWDGSKYSSGIAFPEAKYYDLYTSTNPSSSDSSLSATACNGGVCYGHALSETSKWYQDYAYFVKQTYPWVARGGYWGSSKNAGAFSLDTGDGYANSYRASRVVCIP